MEEIKGFYQDKHMACNTSKHKHGGREGTK